MKSAAIAIDWSTRVNTRLRKSLLEVTGCDFSASMQMRFIASIVSTGYWPLAVSAESITASVPSSTALATSETSARVGTGLEIIDSIICVAVMVSLFSSRASADHVLLQRRHRGVAHLHREVAARDHDAVGGRA